MTPDRRAKLLVRKAQIEAQLKDLEAREQRQKRKDDTRRKIIAGALALEHAEIDPVFGAQLAKLLNRYVTKAQDRALFDLTDRDQDNTPAHDFEEAAKPESAMKADESGR
ncbi:hypothetical protein ACX4MT_00060 [Roseomonas mucosa]